MPANFPSNPTLNQQYSYLGSTWSWSGSYWQLTTSQLVTGINFTYANTAPVAPNPGDRWVDTTTMLELVYVYDGNSYQWIELSSQAPSVNFGSIAANIVPAANITYDLGTTTSRWRDLYLSGNTLYLGAATVSATGSAINLPAGSTVAGATVATSTEVSTGGGPKITNVQVTNNAWTVLDDTAVDIVGGYVKITGTNFVSGCQVIAGTTTASAVSFISSTELRVQFGAVAAGTYVLYVSNPDGGVALRVNGITFSATPAWQTASSLGEIYDAVVINLGLVATSAVNYVVTSGSLPPGLSLTANTGVITGTVTGVTVDTTYNFTVTATDTELQDSPRSFSVTVTVSDPYFRLTTLLLSGSAVSANTVVRDSSTNNFNLTVAGDARASNFTPYGTGWSVYFDGTGDSLSITNTTALQFGTGDFTVEAWVYLTATPGAQYAQIIGRTEYGSNADWMLQITNTRTLTWYMQGSFVSTSTGTILLNTWTQVAATRSGSSIRLFINGTIDGTATNSGSTENTSSGDYTIGADQAADEVNLTGYISNLRVIKGTALYTANFTPATTNLTAVANTSLLTCNANRFLDGSINNIAITRNGDAKVVSFNPFNITNTGVNGSMYFDGTDDRLVGPTSTILDLDGAINFTIEAWVYPTSYGSTADMSLHIVRKFTGAGGVGYAYGIQGGGANQGKISLYGAGGSISLTSTNQVPINTWSHICVVKNSTTFTHYLNGQPNGSVTTATTLTASTDNLLIADYGYAEKFKGYMSELRIVKGTAVYTSAFAPPTSPLTAITNTQLLTLQYDQPHNNHTFLDSSSNQFLITRNGNATQGTFSPFSQAGWSTYLYDGLIQASMGTNGQFGTGDFTVDIWVYPLPGSQATGNLIWSFALYPNGIFLTYGNDGAISVFSYGATRISGSAGTLTLNAWSHIAVSRASTALRLFVNGSQVGSTYTDSSNYTQGFYGIGRPDDVASYYYRGYLSNFRVVKGTALYTANFTPSTSSLTAVTNTQLLILQSNRYRDNSTNNYAITVSGTYSIQAFSPFGPSAVYSPAIHGGSAYFDGTGDYLTVSSSNIYIYDKPFTFASWVYGTSTNFMTLLSWGGGYGNFRIFYNGGNTIQLWDGPSQLLVGTPSTLTINQWFYIVVQRDANNLLAIYHNGVLVTSTTNTGNYNVGTATFAAEPGGGSPLSGYMSGCQLVLGAATYTSGIPNAPPTGANDKISLLLNFTDAAVIDSTGRNTVETVADAKSSSVITKFTGGSMYFDGTGDRLVLPASPNLTFGTSDFTIEMWVNSATQASNSARIMGNGAGGSWGANKWIFTSTTAGNPNKYTFQFWNYNSGGSDLLVSSSTANNSTWTHVAITRSGSTFRMFVNGTLEATQTSANSLDGSSSVYLEIGRSGLTGEDWAGYINDLRITKGYARYTANFTAPTAPARLK